MTLVSLAFILAVAIGFAAVSIRIISAKRPQHVTEALRVARHLPVFSTIALGGTSFALSFISPVASAVPLALLLVIFAGSVREYRHDAPVSDADVSDSGAAGSAV